MSSAGTASSTTQLSDYETFKKTYPLSTQDDYKTYKIDKQKLFKSSIILCVVYGVFALVLLILTMFVARVRDFLAGDFLAFVVTLVCGMIFIIIMIIIQIVTFKPAAFNNSIYDSDMCPDYWKFVPTDSSEYANNNLLTDSDKYLMKYKCVPDESILNKKSPIFGAARNSLTTNLYGQSINTDNTGYYADSNSTYNVELTSNDKGPAASKLRNKDANNTDGKDYIKAMYGVTDNKLKCDVLYPQFLAAKDNKEFPDHPNQLRCAYAKKCGIPWTSVCPEKEASVRTDY